MIGFIDDHRDVYGVEPICRVLPIAPSTYYAQVAIRADPSKASARQQRDAALCPEIQRVWDANFKVYGVRKAWHQLRREGFDVARCTVARLMTQIGLRGAVRGKVIKTTQSDTAAPCPQDKVNRQFRAPAPNMLWVSDFTYVSTWAGFVCVAFVIDTFANHIVGWRVSGSAKTDFVLDALEQALYKRRPMATAAWCITAIAGPNTFPSATPSAWPTLASSPQLEALETATTTPWPRRSMVSTRPR